MIRYLRYSVYLELEFAEDPWAIEKIHLTLDGPLGVDTVSYSVQPVTETLIAAVKYFFS